MAEDDSAEWAGEEGHGVRAKGSECAEGAVDFREEDLREDDGRGSGVDVEVVPFDGGADGGSKAGFESAAVRALGCGVR